MNTKLLKLLVFQDNMNYIKYLRYVWIPNKSCHSSCKINLKTKNMRIFCPWSGYIVCVSLEKKYLWLLHVDNAQSSGVSVLKYRGKIILFPNKRGLSGREKGTACFRIWDKFLRWLCLTCRYNKLLYHCTFFQFFKLF